jgi:hypothetical protein
VSALATAFLLALGGAALSGGIVRALGRWGKKRSGEGPGDSQGRPAKEMKRAAPKLPDFRWGVGDVISVRRTEAWLEHGWLLREAGEAVALVLFSREATVIALPAPKSALYWLSEVSLDWPSEPPSSIDIGSVCYERACRVPVDIEALADAPDPPWQDGLLTEYRALSGEVLWALGRRGAFKAWNGRRVPESDLELWG